MTSGTDNAYNLAKKYKTKTAWGTDTLFDAKVTARQGAQLTKLRPVVHARRNIEDGDVGQC